MTFENRGRLFQVAYPAVRATADKNDIDSACRNRFTGRQLHIVERFFETRIGATVGNRLIDTHDHAGIRAERHHGTQTARIQCDRFIEVRTVVRTQCPPTQQCFVPTFTLRCPRAAVQIFKCRLVGRNHARAGPSFDRHVAYRHALLHIELLDGIAAVFHHVADTAIDANFSNDCEDQILGTHSIWNASLDVDGQRFRLALQQTLRGQHVSYLRRANTEGEGAKCTVRT